MNKFYIFLDVDGVLNSDPIGLYGKLEKQNVNVLSGFLVELENNGYNPIIVVSSNWRHYEEKFEVLKNTLNEMNLKYNGNFLKLSSGLSPVRGRQIDEFLGQKNVENNFVIIDDNMEEIARFFPKTNIIHTGEKGLTQKDIQTFMKNFLHENKKIDNSGKAL